MGMFALLIIILAEWNQGNVLKNDVFVSLLAMIYFVFFSVNNLTYIGLTNFQNFLAILRRLSTVFEMEEYKVTRITSEPEEQSEVTFAKCSFSWGFRVKENQAGSKLSRVLIEAEDKPIISEVNFSLRPKDLLVVIGSVGSGKTTLLHSVLEETRKSDGDSLIRGTIAYVEQEPFIISGSIKANVLMGKVWNEELF